MLDDGQNVFLCRVPGGKHRYDNGRNEIDDHRMIVVSGYDAKIYRRKAKRNARERKGSK